MIELIRDHQLNLMLLLCGACAVLILLIYHTRFLPENRKRILIFMEVMAFLLLWFDRLAYLYAGDTGETGGFMVRLSNFIVFFLTPGMAFGLSLYLADWLKNEGKMKTIPKRMTFSIVVTILGMILAVVAAFTNLYYYFDESNLYHRGSGFLIAYIIPVLVPLIQFTVVIQYRKIFSKLVYASLILYIFVPVICGIIQIFTYGISIVNMSMVAVSVSLYVFTYLDINNTVEHAHKIERENMESEKQRMRRLFDQTATAFVSAVEKKDDYTKGNALRVAEYARRIAALAGKEEEECEKIYYAALLHDVGIIGIPDNVIKNEYDPKKWDRDLMKQKPVIGKEILSCISEYPYLSVGAEFSHERYDGTGYPNGLKGEEIPEIARIIAVADAYVTMTTKKRFREARPDFIAREKLVKGAGEAFDPKFANLMIKIIDRDNREETENLKSELEQELLCEEYRSKITAGIPIDSNITRVTFDCECQTDGEHPFSAPSLILFDSYDRRVHRDEKSIEANGYLEYGEVWFYENNITTAARKIEATRFEKIHHGGTKYEILMGRFEDHLKLKMTSPEYEKEIIVALEGSAKSSYLALTGENCRIKNITVTQTEETVRENDIPRIANEVSYLGRMESDIENIQVDRTRSSHTKGVELTHHLKLMFHTMSLPGAYMVWNCPYIVLFSSEDGTVYGKDYREYALIKLYGENEGAEEYAGNTMTMKKKADFSGWDDWKNRNKKGFECEITFVRKGGHIVIRSENLGIEIENVTEITEIPDKVYVALTGDQVALTDIRVKRGKGEK
ncbi:MAG: HD domain-containing protein [Lachnospiraceae bacterium]|nr:HD domain-containing protein [Lachnospiraceae bacterium]